MHAICLLFIIQTRLETEQRFWQSKQNEWEVEKQRILNTLIGSSSELIDVSAETSNLFSDVSTRIEGRSAMDSMEMAYARQVGERIIYFNNIQPLNTDTENKYMYYQNKRRLAQKKKIIFYCLRLLVIFVFK